MQKGAAQPHFFRRGQVRNFGLTPLGNSAGVPVLVHVGAALVASRIADRVTDRFSPFAGC
jgi:hypothetical protein